MIRAFVIAIGVALLVPGVASAKPKVAIVAFEDDSSGELQDVVAELLEDGFSVVGPRQTTRAIDKLGYDPAELTSKKMKKIARELEVDAIVRGDVGKKNGRKLLHIKLFVNGKKVRGFKVEFVSSRSNKFKEALKDKLLEKLGAGGGGDDGETKKKKPKDDDDKGDKNDKDRGDKDDKDKGDKGDEDVVDKKAKKSKQEKDDEDGDEDDDKKKRTASRDGDDEEPIDGEVEGGMSAAPTLHSINRAAVRVDFGVSFSRRQLTFKSRAFEEAPKPYANNPVPGGRVEADIYPLAFKNPNGIVGGIGIGGEYDQTIVLNLQSTVQPGTKFPVKQSHFSVGARLRFVFGKKATSPSVVLKGGYAARTFTVDRTKLEMNNVIDLPDVGYRGFTAGLDLRVPIAGPVALFAGGGAIFVSTTGAIQEAEQYGRAKVTGAEARAGVDIAIGRRMAVKVMGEFCQMGFAFSGTGQMSNNRDGDPASKDVGGAADRYLGGALLFGVLY